MEKNIEFTRRELVWEEYRRVWRKADYLDFLQWLSTSQHKDDQVRYSYLKVLSFDDIYDIMRGVKPDVVWELEYTNYIGETHTFKESLISYIQDIMREDALDYGVYDCRGADDAEEDLEFFDPAEDDMAW